MKDLFASGKSLNAYPLKLIYATVDASEDAPLKTGVGASSRHFKHAVDRNRIKRLLRESYRLRKGKLLPVLEKNKSLVLFFLYTGKELPKPEQIDEALNKLLDKLMLILQPPIGKE